MNMSLISDRHFSTHPYSSDAVFSILTGRYPHNRANFVARGSTHFSSLLTSRLAASGYQVGVHATYGDTCRGDVSLYSRLGAAKSYIPDGAPAPADLQSRFDEWVRTMPAAGIDTLPEIQRARFSRILREDFAAFGELRRDVSKLKTAGRRFFSVYLPQTGHAPWPALVAGESVEQRGARMLQIQDIWLTALLEELQQNAWLDSTLIVVTGDHGIRTRVEDPAFPGGTISDYSFNVPLILFAPDAVKGGMRIQPVTSHIDLMPTLAGLLGMAGTGHYVHGVPVWCEELAQRTLFFNAVDYLGAEGLHRGDRYVMHQLVTGAVFESDRMDFPPDSLVTPARARAYKETFTDAARIFSRWNGE
jgi:membrane-anchored protein YejM (alkaline phosphatase superfamily)